MSRKHTSALSECTNRTCLGNTRQLYQSARTEHVKETHVSFIRVHEALSECTNRTCLGNTRQLYQSHVKETHVSFIRVHEPNMSRKHTSALSECTNRTCLGNTRQLYQSARTEHVKETHVSFIRVGNTRQLYQSARTEHVYFYPAWFRTSRRLHNEFESATGTLTSGSEIFRPLLCLDREALSYES